MSKFPEYIWKQDWADYYVNGKSDVDFVVEMSGKVKPHVIAERLQKKGPWRMIGQVQVHKFASTQFTMLGRFDDQESSDDPDNPGDEAEEVYLDITCIENPLHVKRFHKRQKAFRDVFSEARANVETQFGLQGALAFDAYIHILKAFAAKVLGNAFSGFQATCIGIFTLQIGHFRLKPTHSIALSFFEGFLRFCLTFYGDCHPQMGFNYRQYAIDLSHGGRFLQRKNSTWRSELYFMQAEDDMKTTPDERVNIAHSLDPSRVCVEAYELLEKAFGRDCSPFMFGQAPMG